MKLEIKFDLNMKEPNVVITTSEITDEVEHLIKIINRSDEQKIKENMVIALQEEKTIVLSYDNVYLIRIVEGETWIYCKEKRYVSKYRLSDMEKNMNHDFIRISKTAIVNLKCVSYVEPYFNGTMCVVLKNGIKDYISRKYLHNFKEALGI